ncbi:MAG: hypothetical protein WDN75_04010 [Bacteroidota bacterium]
MKVQKALSVVFILMVLLSSTGYTSPNDFMVEPDEPPTELGYHISEDSDVDLLEFRQVVGVSVASNVAIVHSGSFFEASQLVFTSVSFVQVTSFLQKYLSGKPAIKLFIDLGVLVI